MPTMLLLRQMAEKHKMEKIDPASLNNLPSKLNDDIPGPPPAEGPLLVRGIHHHAVQGAGQTANMKRGYLQKVLDISGWTFFSV